VLALETGQPISELLDAPIPIIRALYAVLDERAKAQKKANRRRR